MPPGIVRLFTLVGVAALLGGCEDPLDPGHEGISAAKVGTAQSLAARADSPRDIILTWQDRSNNETGFEVHRAALQDGPFTLLDRTGSNVTGYVHGGLEPSTQYCYRVRAFRQTGTRFSYGEFSNVACATTLALPRIEPPSKMGAGPVHSTAIAISWKDNSANEDGFRVERAGDVAGPWQRAVNTGPDIIFTYDFVSSEQQVCYRVIAFNAQLESDPSNLDCTTAPAEPTSLAAVTLDQQSIDLSWQDNSGVEDGYEVSRSVAEGPWNVVATLPASANGYRDDAVIANSLHEYSVRATKDGGFSGPSNTAGLAIVSQPPAMPANVDALPSSSSVVFVYWPDQRGIAEGFRVERSPDGMTSWATVATTGAGETGVYDAGVLSEQRVYYRVLAVNQFGESPPSLPDSTTPPVAPTNFDATVIDEYTLKLTWDDQSRVEDGYEVWISTPEDFYPMVRLPPDATSALVGRYVGGFAYYLVATKDGGYSDLICCIGAEGASLTQTGALSGLSDRLRSRLRQRRSGEGSPR